MKDVFQALQSGLKAQQYVQDKLGKVDALQWGVVSNVDDELGLGRIKVRYESKDSSQESDWLSAALPFSNMNYPVAQLLGHPVIFGYVGGTPSNGVYFGCLQYLRNPVIDKDSFVFYLGQSLLQINPGFSRIQCQDSSLTLLPDTTVIKVDGLTITIKDKLISVDGVDSFTVAGKQVATVGATDSDGDKLVLKGWS